MSNVRSTNSNYTKLKKPEEKLDTLLKNIINATNGGTNISKDYLKDYVAKTFDGMKEATLDVLNDSWGSNEDFNNNAQNVGITDALSTESTFLQPDKLNNSPLPRQPEEIGFPAVISLDKTDEYSVKTSRRDDEEDTDKDDATPAEPEADRADEPNTEDAVTDEGAQPTTEDEEFQQEVLSMLTRMTNTLIGFFRWLKTKVKELASKAWQKVCEAFTAMCTFLSNVAERVRGSRNRANYSKLHMA